MAGFKKCEFVCVKNDIAVVFDRRRQELYFISPCWLRDEKGRNFVTDDLFLSQKVYIPDNHEMFSIKSVFFAKIAKCLGLIQQDEFKTKKTNEA